MLPAAKRARAEEEEAGRDRRDDRDRDLEGELRRKDAALKAALRVLCATRSPMSWADMPPELRSDPTVVTEAIAGNLFPSLRRDDIPPGMLERHVLPELLANHRDAAVQACVRGLLKWEEVLPTPAEWRQSRVLSLVALYRGLLAGSNDLTAHAHPSLTPAVLVRMIRRAPRLLWERIPAHLQGDREFCRSLFQLDDGIPLHEDFDTYLVAQVFALHPELRQDRQVWENMLNCRGLCITTLFDQGLAPDDTDSMRLVLQQKPFILDSIDQQVHEELVKETVDHEVRALYSVSAQFIDRNRQFVTLKLLELGCAERGRTPRSRGFAVSQLAETIPPDMWSDDDFTLTWFTAGLPLVEATHPAAWRADRAKLLMVAEHSAWRGWTLRSFRIMETELRNDVEFLTRAMGHDPAIFEFASETVREGNFRLAIQALTEPSFVGRCLDTIHSRRQRDAARDAGRPQFGFGLPAPFILSPSKMEELRAQAVREVEQHRVFVNPFLCGVYLSGETGLGMLRQFPQPGFLETIADFAGIPRNGHLGNLRRALENLAAVSAEAENEGAG